MDLLESFLFSILNTVACWNSELFKLRYPKVQVNLLETGYCEAKTTPSESNNKGASDKTTQLTKSDSTRSDSFSLNCELSSTQEFNFDKWIKGEGTTLNYSRCNNIKGNVSWNMLINSDNPLKTKIKKTPLSSSLVTKEISDTQPSFSTPKPVPELFNVKRCCPSYFFSEQQRQNLCSQGWFKDELSLTPDNLNSFKKEINFNQLNDNMTKHLQEYKNYQKSVENKSSFEFNSISTLAQAQIIYRYYVEILYPSFNKNLHVITYMNISCHRLVSLLKDLVIAPQDLTKNISKMESFLHSLHKVNPKACLFLFHYLASTILDFIEVPEKNYTDESVWRKVLNWLYNLQPKQSDLIIRTHFIHRCPQVLEQALNFPEHLDLNQTKVRHGFRSSSHLLRLQEFLLTSSPESNISSDSSNESLEEEKILAVKSDTKESAKVNEQLNLNIDEKLKLKTNLPEFPDFEDIEISDAEDLVIDDSNSPVLSGICLSDAEEISKESQLLSNTNNFPSHFNNDNSTSNLNTGFIKNVSIDSVRDNGIGSVNVADKNNVDMDGKEKSTISGSIENDFEDSDQVSKSNDPSSLAPLNASTSSRGIDQKDDLNDFSIGNTILEDTIKTTHVPTIVHSTHFLDSSPSIPEIKQNQSQNDDDLSNSNENIDNTGSSSSSEESSKKFVKPPAPHISFPNIFSLPDISEDFELESDEIYKERMCRLMKAYMYIESLRFINSDN